MSKFSLTELAAIEGVCATMSRLACVMATKDIFASHDATLRDRETMEFLYNNLKDVFEPKEK